MQKSILFLLTAVLMAACTQEPKQEAFSEDKALEFLYQYMPSFNFMAAITICSDFGAQKNKV